MPSRQRVEQDLGGGDRAGDVETTQHPRVNLAEAGEHLRPA
ncbi:MAG: hypothetical protein U1E43_02455 [Rhodospirillales bacterium]